MPQWLIALLVGTGLGLWLGTFVARKSAARKPIRGGPPAHLFHYLGISASIGALLTFLIGSMLYKLPSAQSLGLCGGLFLLQFVLLVFYAFFDLQKAGRT